MAAKPPKNDGTGRESTAIDSDPISAQMDQVRAAATKLLSKSQGASPVVDMATALEKAATAFKLAAEMGKTRLDLAQVNEEIAGLRRQNQTASKREKSERLRDYVALLTPLVTIITLGATLVVQSWQFSRTEQDKQEAALDAQWSEAVKSISTSGGLSPGVIALQPFLRSAKYRDRARNVAVNLLAGSSEKVFFDNLFGPALLPVSWDNLDLVLQLDRALSARMMPLLQKTWDEKIQDNDEQRLTDQERAAYHYILEATSTITAQVGSLLKTPMMSAKALNLSSTYFREGDWSDIDLGAANLAGSDITYINLKGTDLKGITQFGGAGFFGIAWWEAKSMNRSLLTYLEKNYPYKPGQVYGPRYETVEQKDYDAAIARLKSQAH